MSERKVYWKIFLEDITGQLMSFRTLIDAQIHYSREGTNNPPGHLVRHGYYHLVFRTREQAQDYYNNAEWLPVLNSSALILPVTGIEMPLMPKLQDWVIESQFIFSNIAEIEKLLQKNLYKCSQGWPPGTVMLKDLRILYESEDCDG